MGCLANVLRLIFVVFFKRIVERLIETVIERLTGGRKAPLWLTILLTVLALLGLRIKPRS